MDDCGISRVNFQPTGHVQLTLRHLSFARSFIAHMALYWLVRAELMWPPRPLQAAAVRPAGRPRRADLGTGQAAATPLPLHGAASDRWATGGEGGRGERGEEGRGGGGRVTVATPGRVQFTVRREADVTTDSQSVRQTEGSDKLVRVSGSYTPFRQCV